MYRQFQCLFSFQDSSPLLNEVSSSRVGTNSQTFAPVTKPSSAYPSTTIVNPTIVLLQHNRGKGVAPLPQLMNQHSYSVTSGTKILPFHTNSYKFHSSLRPCAPVYSHDPQSRFGMMSGIGISKLT